MKAHTCGRSEDGFDIQEQTTRQARRSAQSAPKPGFGDGFRGALDGWFDLIAPCPWNAHTGLSAVGTHTAWTDQSGMAPYRHVKAEKTSPRQPIYTPEERSRRDATPWTIVQAILAPVQFLAFAISVVLIFRFMVTGQGYGVATASILVKTALLYVIMITGSIWEKVVFGKWLFARAFFWEDAFSMLVLALQTAYLVTLLAGWGTATEQMSIAVAAYAAYAVNASQFLLKLRAAQLEGARRKAADSPLLVA